MEEKKNTGATPRKYNYTQKTGRPVKLSEWTTPEKLAIIEAWARRMTRQDVAQHMGIAVSTLYRWQTESKELKEALRVGSESADAIAENKLFENILRGDMQAIKFWLERRQPDVWRQPRAELDVAMTTEMPEAIKGLTLDELRRLAGGGE